jgi:hypothetical protein
MYRRVKDLPFFLLPCCACEPNMVLRAQALCMESVIPVKQFRQTYLSVLGASSAVPSVVNLQQYEGALEKQSAYIFPQLGTNIIQLLLFSFNSGDSGKGV